jgi:hypothetical protein
VGDGAKGVALQVMAAGDLGGGVAPNRKGFHVAGGAITGKCDTSCRRKWHRGKYRGLYKYRLLGYKSVYTPGTFLGTSQRPLNPVVYCRLAAGYPGG